MNAGLVHPQQGRTPAAQLDRWAPVVVGLLFFVLYALTAAPSIVEFFDDTLEFQFVLPTFGIAHPTGYPLYTMLGGLWSNALPLGTWAGRANLFSALAGAVAVGLLARLTLRLAKDAGLRHGWAGALIAALLFGLGPVWWSQSTVAEVYALHLALLLATLNVAVEIGMAKEIVRQHRLTLWLALLLGLGLAHHRTIVLAGPALLVWLLWRAPALWRPHRRQWGYLLALTAPLLLYLYLPLRSAQGVSDLNGAYQATLSGFLDHVLARNYGSFFAANPLWTPRSWPDWFALHRSQWGWAGIGLLAIGSLAPIWHARLRSGVTLLGVTFLTNLLFALLYRVGDQEVFLLPVFAAGAGLAGLGLLALLQPLSSRVATAAALALLAVAALGAGRGGAVNRSRDWAAHDSAVDMAGVPFPPGSQVIGLEGQMTALRYMQRAAGLGANATPVVADDPLRRAALLAGAVTDGVPVYLTQELDGIAEQYSFSGEGPLVRVWPRGEAQVGLPTEPLEIAMAEGAITLAGVDRQRLEWAGGPVARVAFYWRAESPVEERYKVSLRVVDAQGEPLRWPDGAPATADRYPLRLVAPTTSWLPGELIRDLHEVALPPAAVTGAYRLQAILYREEDGGEAGRVELAGP